MRFEEAMLAMRNGEKVKRKDWRDAHYTILPKLVNERESVIEGYGDLSIKDIMAEDWEIKE